MAHAVLLPYVERISTYHGLGPLPEARVRRPVVHAPAMPAPLIIHGGGGGYNAPARQTVQIIADPQMAREMRNQELEDRAEGKATLAAWVGGIATIFLSGGIALALGNLKKDVKEGKKAEEFIEKVQLIQDPLLRAQAEEVARAHSTVIKSKIFYAKTFAWLTGMALASAAGGFVGGMLSIPWVITASLVSGVFVACGFMVTIATRYIDDEVYLSADLKRLVSKLQISLSTAR